jgi:hypothetical protein
VSRNRLSLGLLGIPVFLITILINFPAEPIAERLRVNTLSTLNWQSMTGSIFNVEISGFSITTKSGRNYYLDKLVLQTSVLPLLTGRIITHVSTQIEDAYVKAELEMYLNQWRLNQVDGTIKMNELSSLFPEISLIGIQGELEIKGEDISGQYNELPNTGKLDLTLQSLNLDLFQTNRSLGNYRLLFTIVENTQMQGKISMMEGKHLLNIDADIFLNIKEKNILVKGSAWTGEDASEPVSQLLPLIGRLENGRAQINWANQF